MLSKAHLTSDSRMSGSRSVITPLWLPGSWRLFYTVIVYSCHIFLISSASFRSISFMSFIKPILAWNVPLVSNFLEEISSLSHSVVFLYFFALIAEEGFLISSCYSVRTGHGTTDWFQIGKGVCQGCILSPCLFNLYTEYIMRNTGLEEAQAGIKIARSEYQ